MRGPWTPGRWTLHLEPGEGGTPDAAGNVGGGGVGSAGEGESRADAQARARAANQRAREAREAQEPANRLARAYDAGRKAVRDFVSDLEDTEVKGVLGIVGDVAQMAVDDMFDGVPATPEQMAGHVADHAETSGPPAGLQEAREEQQRLAQAGQFMDLDWEATWREISGAGEPMMPGAATPQWMSRIEQDIAQLRSGQGGATRTPTGRRPRLGVAEPRVTPLPTPV